MSRYPRKILSNTYTSPTTSSASGSWDMVEQMQARKSNNWPEPVPPYTLLLNAYNDGVDNPVTGTISIPVGTTKLYVFGCAGGGSGGYVREQDNGCGAGGGGAANLTGFEITSGFTAGGSLSYTIGRGGYPQMSNTSRDGEAGGDTFLANGGSNLFIVYAGQGGIRNGGSGGAGGNAGNGVAGGTGGVGGIRDSRNGGNGNGATNAGSGGGGGGAHVSNKTGGNGGSTSISGAGGTFGVITVSFIGAGGGSAGTPYSSGNAAPTNVNLARGGYGVAQDSNTGAGGGAGGGIKPVVNGVEASYYYGGGGGGYRSYVMDITPSYDGRGGGGFLIVIAKS